MRFPNSGVSFKIRVACCCCYTEKTLGSSGCIQSHRRNPLRAEEHNHNQSGVHQAHADRCYVQTRRSRGGMQQLLQVLKSLTSPAQMYWIWRGRWSHHIRADEQVINSHQQGKGSDVKRPQENEPDRPSTSPHVYLGACNASWSLVLG